VSTGFNQTVLVFSTLDAFGTRRALAQLKSRYERAQITLLTPAEFVKDFVGSTSIDRLYIYDRQRILLRTAVALLRRLRRERFDIFVILCQDISRTDHLHNLILFSFLIPCRRRMLADTSLLSRSLGIRSRISSLLNNILPVAAPLARILTAIVFYLCCIFPATPPHIPSKNGLGRGTRIAVLIPVLPDLSHIFIYREVLAMRRMGAQFDVVALEEGDHSILHPEARTLLEGTIFVPRISQTRYLMLYLYFLIRHPMRLKRLLSQYVSHNHGDMFLFLDMNQFHNSLHPMKGIVLAWELKKRRISYIHIYGSTYPATRGIVASFLLNIPFSMSTFVDFDYDYEFKMFREKAELACFIVATTHFCADRIRSYTSEHISQKVHVIHLGIDEECGQTYRDGIESGRDKLPYIIAVGRLVEKKGFDYLVKACSLLRARRLTPRCVIVGKGPDEEKLLSLIDALGLEDEVELAGPVQNDQLFRLYLRPKNILVAPSVYAKDGERDGIPTVLLEAMISGVPVISTTVSGIPELITDGKNGLLVPDRDEYALADAMEKLLRNSRLRERLRREGRQRIRENFRTIDSARRLWSLVKCESEDSS